ncbi:MAG TPA: hypothetical protein VHZ03_13645 [Trebonia sp.]|nr:hypothetical protein [Trebonia sp.]
MSTGSGGSGVKRSPRKTPNRECPFRTSEPIRTVPSAFVQLVQADRHPARAT